MSEPDDQGKLARTAWQEVLLLPFILVKQVFYVVRAWLKGIRS